jgi:very-short-patch-repair endonuclease
MAGQIQRCMAEVRAIARAQHHVVSRAQLLAIGLSRHAIAHMVDRGHLHQLFRGVYAVGRREVSWRGWWMAGVLACGPDAVLSHGSAAALWGIRPATRELHVSAPGVRRSGGVVSHRRALRAGEITCRYGIPVTSVICTVIDIAPGLSRNELERAANEADKLDLVDPEELRDALRPQRGRPGIAKVRTTLDRRTFTMTDSELERLLLPIARRAGLPKPLTQVYVNGRRVDFYFPELGVVVETDGLRYHRTPAQQARDRERDQAHFAAGIIPLRFTRAQVKFQPAHVREVLAAVAARRGRRPPRASSPAR